MRRASSQEYSETKMGLPVSYHGSDEDNDNNNKCAHKSLVEPVCDTLYSILVWGYLTVSCISWGFVVCV